MPRNRRQRRIVAPPRFRGYRPYGCIKQNEDPVELLYEEYEAIKLADYQLMNHQEASLHMGVSRATFARIYENARRKIARALVETKEIITITGNSYSENNWFLCKQCNARYTIPLTASSKCCPLCQSEEVESAIKH